MRRWWMMSLALCLSTPAFAGNWAGIPLDSLSAIGIAEPALSEVSDVWRAAHPVGTAKLPLPTGIEKRRPVVLNDTTFLTIGLVVTTYYTYIHYIQYVYYSMNTGPDGPGLMSQHNGANSFEPNSTLFSSFPFPSIKISPFFTVFVFKRASFGQDF